MTPHRTQLLFAHDLPARLWFALVPLLFAGVAAWLLGSWPDTLHGDAGRLRYAALLGMAWLAGLCIAGLSGWVFLGPLYRRAALRNGAPFAEGDQVEGLCGRLRGRTARVLEVWAWRGQLRVENPDSPADPRGIVVRDVQVRRVAEGERNASG